jgi:hypothetical protein
LTQIIAPMMKVRRSVLIAFSTHQGEENYYSKLFSDKDPEMDRLYIRYHVELVCKACKSKGKTPGECAHVAHLNPDWLLTSNEGRVKKLMGNDEESYAREVLGAFWTNTGQVFKAAWVNNFRKRPFLPIRRNKLRILLTIIDTAGGGDSRTAICTLGLDTFNNIIIVGLDEAQILEGPEQIQFVQKYFNHFVNDSVLNKVVHMIAVERNYGGSLMAAGFVQAAKLVCPNLLELTDVKVGQLKDLNNDCVENGQHGVWTSSEVNHEGGLMLMWALHDDQVHFGRMLIRSDTVTIVQTQVQPVAESVAGVVGSDDTSKVVESDVPDFLHVPPSEPCPTAPYPTASARRREQMLSQLTQFRKVVRGSTGHWTFSGKRRSGDRDDMAMCLLLGMYYMSLLKSRLPQHDDSSLGASIVQHRTVDGFPNDGGAYAM